MSGGDSTARETMDTPEHPMSIWLEASRASVGRHALLLLSERDGQRSGVLASLQAIARGHYVPPERMARYVEVLGAPRAALLLREHLPTTTIARSADAGEILATEVVEHHLGFVVPIRRLRWKDGREVALRGDDVIGVDGALGALRLLKGEAKSRARLSARVVEEAGEALDRNRGRPTPHTVLFIADRLRELGDDGLAEALENAVLSGFHGVPIEHMVFVLAGNSVEALLRGHLEAASGRRLVRRAVGLRIPDHSEFIASLFEEP